MIIKLCNGEQMTEWFTNILNREQEVIYNAQGQPMTSTPEDFFNLIHLQASTHWQQCNKSRGSGLRVPHLIRWPAMIHQYTHGELPPLITRHIVMNVCLLALNHLTIMLSWRLLSL